MDNIISKPLWDAMTIPERRQALMDLEDACKEFQGDEPIPVEMRHYNAAGVYAREMIAPKGMVIVGEIHKTENINTLSKGRIRVATEDGVRDLEAPATFVSKAGTKRAGVTLTDVVWTVYHATELTDPDEIRKQFIAEDYTELDKQLENTRGDYELDSSSNGSNSSVHGESSSISSEESEET